MNRAKALMKQAHMRASQPLTPAPVVSGGVKETPVTPRPEPPAPQPVQQVVVPAPQVQQKPKAKPTGVMQIARNDVPLESYGVKAVATNFNCYNKELFDWLRTFSSNNQFSGGVAITKSQIIEIALDVLFYDLGINPIGYESQQALREDIQNKIRGM